mgnify:CR=1 FL=1
MMTAASALITQAMVLSAGRGERLRPLTDTAPKPLLTIGDRPLLVHQLQRLHMAGIEHVVINLGWLGEQIPKALEEWLSQPPLLKLKVSYSQEPQGALETAGGIRHAIDRFTPGPVVVISADAWCDLDYRQLTTHRLQRAGHLIMVDNPNHHPAGDFVLDDGLIQLPKDSTERTVTFAGLGVFSTELFGQLPEGHRRLRPVLESAIRAEQLTGTHFKGQWLDLGTPERLQTARDQWMGAWPSTRPPSESI